MQTIQKLAQVCAQYGGRNMSTLEVFVEATFSYRPLSNKRTFTQVSFDMRLLYGTLRHLSGYSSPIANGLAYCGYRMPSQY